jgi:endonuclease III
MTARQLTNAYLTARERVIESGYSHEIDWQDSRYLSEISEQDFLKETAWVILNSGMREQVIRSKFGAICEAFFNWKSASIIHTNSSICMKNALEIFNHKGKISAIIHLATHINYNGFEFCKGQLFEDGVRYLMKLNYIGPVTAYHLAKNIGLDVAKPDRHLTRIANHCGYVDVSDFCKSISQITGDRISTIDLVFWRYANLNTHNEEMFSIFRSCAS